MKSMIWKTTFREIKQSFGRYFAILAIVALGVGFFSGLKITKQAMVYTVNQYYYESGFFDLHLLSSIGFEDSDIEAFRDEEAIKYVEAVYTMDALYSGIGENEIVLKTHSIPENINKVDLVAGRMPENMNECLLDAHNVSENMIGKTIQLSDTNDSDLLEMFNATELTVVGIANSSYYLNFERGNTSLGTGKINGFIYVPEELFHCDYYTDVYVCFDQEYEIYSDEYEDFMDGKIDTWKEICSNQAELRYEKLVEDARNELEDAKNELEEKKLEGKQELDDALAKLKEAEEDVKHGETEISDAWKKYYESLQELQGAQDTITTTRNELLEKQETLNSTLAQINEKEKEIVSQEQQLSVGALLMDPQQYFIAKKTIEEGKKQIAVARKEIEDGKLQIENGFLELEAKEIEVNDGIEKLNTGKLEILSNEKKLRDAKDELKDGWDDYNDGLAEYEKAINEAEKEIMDAEQEISDIPAPDCYVLDRGTNIGYVCFNSDSDIVNSVAKVFPVFFFLVAALVCMTTMNRMVEEQRTQIGVLKALGYSEVVIMIKYMIYSGSAALTGCIIGFFGGIYVFPKVIWATYHLMYELKDIKYVIDWKLAGIALLVSMICSIGTTWISCRLELKEAAAELMRPKAPKAGKRILLERIPFIWKRLKFLQKVSARNIFRYKKRFFMMIIGISGCTALLLTGFGLKDSIANFATQQYDEIQIYDGSYVLKDSVSDEKDVLIRLVEENTKEYACVSESTWDIVTDSQTKPITMLIFENPDVISNYMNLVTVKGEKIAYPKAGEAVISDKIAKNHNISIGDKIVLRDSDMNEIEVAISGIFENHVYNYIILNPETFCNQMNKNPEYKVLYVNYEDNQDPYQIMAKLMKEENVISSSFNQDTKERMAKTMRNMNYVVILVIVCAAALAFIVLYNLTNINITERIREIATIKVLGFFRNETASYVFRENIILTGIGSVVGIGLGILLHRFVMNQINVDLVSFSTIIQPISYVISIMLTFAFNIIVNQVMTGKLEKINMAESLKSVD